MNTNDKSRDNRKPLNATHGKDRIEIEKKEAERLSEMGKFAPMDGNLGDESKDKGDMPIQERKNDNGYDPALATGGSPNPERPSGADGMHIVRGGSGITAKKGDSYVDEDGNKKIAEQKKDANKKNP